MDFKVINLKEFNPSVELAIANLEIEIELAKSSNIKAIKFIHGYGSHGAGGAICLAVRRKLISLVKNKIIKFYITGSEWTLEDERAREIIYACPSSSLDEDIGHFNPGITIVVIN